MPDSYSSLSFNPFVVTITLTVVTYILVLHLWSKRPPNGPPGSNGLPLLGVILSLRALPERIMASWGKKYGPVYMVKFGTVDVVVIGSPDVAYEAFAKNDCFNDRPQTLPTLCGYGIVLLNSSDFHKEQRRFGLLTLREFGMGRRSLEPRLIEISNELCENIDALCGKGGVSDSFEIHPLIYTMISNVISCLLFGYDVAEEKPGFKAIINTMMKSTKRSTLLGVLMFAPFLRHLPVFSQAWKRSKKFGDDLREKIRDEVLSHQKTRDPKNPRDLVDCFLNELDKQTRQDNEGFSRSGSVSDRELWEETGVELQESENSDQWKSLSSFSIDQLLALGRDLFIAGTDTTSSAICWIILFLCNYPEVQRRMQNEIDDVLGQTGVPRMSIVHKLPYVQAVIQEVSRMRPTVPLSVPHMASRDASLLGYHIPKGAIILTNIWAIHHDEIRWPEPERFSPERHLNEKGKFVKSPNWMIFNVGGRNCLGQQLAKMELFFSTVALFRRFECTLPPGTIPDMNGRNAASLRPLHFEIVAKRRA